MLTSPFRIVVRAALMLIFVTAVLPFNARAVGPEGMSGGGDGDVPEFLLIAHRLLNWQLRHPATKAFRPDVFALKLRNLELSLSPRQGSTPKLSTTDVPISENGIGVRGRVQKSAWFNIVDESITFYWPAWDVMPSPKKYVLVAEEFMGLSGDNRYFDAMIIQEQISEISQTEVELNPILNIVSTEIMTTSLGSTITWIKNLLSEGLYNGHDFDGTTCKVRVTYYPAGWQGADGIRIETLTQRGSGTGIFNLVDDGFCAGFGQEGRADNESAPQPTRHRLKSHGRNCRGRNLSLGSQRLYVSLPLTGAQCFDQRHCSDFARARQNSRQKLDLRPDLQRPDEGGWARRGILKPGG